MYLLSLEGGPLKLVQHTPKVQTTLQYVSDDSTSLYFRANDKEPASYAIYRYDITADRHELVFEEKGLWRIADHRGDVAWLLVKDLAIPSRRSTSTI